MKRAPGRNRDRLLSWSRNGVFAVAALRAALGGTAIVCPTVALRPWVGQPRDSKAVTVLARAAGARDIALGVGAWLAWARQDVRAVRTWARAAAFCDVVEAVTTLTAWRDLPARGRVLVAVAAAGAAAVSVLGTPGR